EVALSGGAGQETAQLLAQLSGENWQVLSDEAVWEWHSGSDWRRVVGGKRYGAAGGMAQVGKALGSGLEIWRQCRVVQLVAQQGTWELILTGENDCPQSLQAEVVVLAIPGPQALMVLQASAIAWPQRLLQSLAAVEYEPCLTVMAGFAEEYRQELEQRSPQWQFLKMRNHADLRGIQLANSSPVFVLHSTPGFAAGYLEAIALEPAGELLLKEAAALLFPWLASPEWVQAHRWRYAFPRVAAIAPCLRSWEPLPLVCCGDWCGGNSGESALSSGLNAATTLHQWFQGQ
ncbi:MAG: FAD-dependent oxidoreductase, partial [Chloroflexaceae bacterium]|nr:FAD-dependent oxidoreductase [Chloroflexaceae bacterium]